MRRTRPLGVDDVRLERRRQLCKVNQRRYRLSQIALNSRREVHLDELRRATRRLEAHVTFIERGLWCHAEEQSILEYIRLFEHGYMQSPRQDAFLNHFVSPDGLCMGQRGVEGVIASWNMYNSFFVSTHVVCTRLEPLFCDAYGEVAVAAFLVGRLTVSLATIQALFPHLLHRKDLLPKIVGSELLLPMKVTYIFDDSKQVVRQVNEANVVEAMWVLLGKLDDVDAAMKDVGIRPDAILVPARHRTELVKSES